MAAVFGCAVVAPTSVGRGSDCAAWTSEAIDITEMTFARLASLMSTLLVLASLVFVLERLEFILELIDQRPHFLDAAGSCPLFSTPALWSCVLPAVPSDQGIACQGIGPDIVFELPSSLSVNPAISHVARCLSACRAVGRSGISTGRILSSARRSDVRFLDIGRGNHWLIRCPVSLPQLP
jgi:hypothetical protein